MKFKRSSVFGRSGRGDVKPGRTSGAFGAVHKHIGSGEHPKALAELNRLASRFATPLQRARITALSALTQFNLGRYPEAARLYRAAIQLAGGDITHSEAALNAALGEIRSLVLALDLEQASHRAEQLRQQFTASHEKQVQAERQAAAQLRQLPAVRIGPRPVRLGVALTRLASLFDKEGYTDLAKRYLEILLPFYPNGAARARQLLAHILLTERDYARVEELARQSLLWGKFQAKTLASWPLLLRARHLRQLPPLDPALYEQLWQSQPARVGARAHFIIVNELRSLGDVSWSRIASDWIRQRGDSDPVIRFELVKLLLADRKIAPQDPPQLLHLARMLWSDPLLSAKESVALAKNLVEYGLVAGETIRPLDLVATLKQRFGSQTADQAAHAMCLGAMLAKRHDLARAWLHSLLNSLPEGSEAWGKALWALARMESGIEAHADAARHYLRLARSATIPLRFRLQSLLRGLRAAESAGQTFDPDSLQAEVEALVASIEDHEVLLDAGRQLALAGPRFRRLLLTVTRQAEARAWSAFHAQTDPAAAVYILNHLARRQFYDLYRAETLLQQWQQLPEAKLQWLWTQEASFWEYLSLVLRSYLESNHPKLGEDLARNYLEDSATPPAGQLYLGTHFALWLLHQSRAKEAFHWLDRVRETSPTHRLAAHAHYWSALQAFRAGHRQIAERSARLARQCLSPKPGLHWEWTLDARAALLLRRLSSRPDSIDTRHFTTAKLTQEADGLDYDLRLLP